MKRLWLWLLAAAGIAGLVYYSRRRAQPAGAPAPTAASAESGLSAAIDAAKAAAERIRGSVGKDALVANLLHLDASLLAPISDPAKAAEVKRIQSEIANVQGDIEKANAQWNINHFGGVTRDMFASYVAEKEGIINELQRQLIDLA